MNLGSRIGPYEVVAAIGAGGMGEVYRARDSRLNRDVALKVLPASTAGDAERLRRFEREAQVLAALNHQNIAAIYGLEGPALVMEFVEGEMLSGPKPVEETIALAKQIAEALEYAHEKGIIHRDLKPANIKVTPSGQVKVLDFGLAKAMAEDPETQNLANSPTLSMGATKTGVILGTAAYMAPEQARGSTVDKRADIWAFGAVLFELLAGKRLIDEPTASDALAAVLKSNLDFNALPAATPPRIRRLIERCLKRDPKLRLRDIGEARIALDSPDEQITLAAPAQGGPKRSVVAWIAAAAVFALVATAVSVVHFREMPPEAPVTRFPVGPPEGANFTGPFALSPDGRKLAFSARGKDRKVGLWIRAMDSLAAYPLPGTEQAVAPFWSPDSKSIAYFAGGKLKRIEASGGPATALCDASSFTLTGSWGREGVIVFSLPSQRGVLRRVAAAGGAASPATVVDSREQEAQVQPWFLPDGDHFLYVARTPQGDKVRVASLKASGKDAKDVMATTSNVAFAQGHLVFQRETTLMAQPFDLKRFALAGEAVPVAEQVRLFGRSRTSYFSISDNGLLAYQAGDGPETQLAWVDRTGKLLEKIGEPGIMGPLHISRNGKTAAVSVQDKAARMFDIWLYDLTREIGSRFTLDSTHDEEHAVFSPDGATVVFRSDRKQKGVFDLYRSASDGSGPEELLFADGTSKTPNAVSPDGKSLLYSIDRGPEGAALMVLPLTGEAKPFTFAVAGYHAQFSPDGRWVAYQFGGPPNIFVAPFRGPGGKWQISPVSGVLPRWRPDGKELFYVDNDQLMAVEVHSKGATLEFGKPQALFEPIRTALGPSYAVAPDGKRFLVIQYPERVEGGPLTIVQNWVTALRR